MGSVRKLAAVMGHGGHGHSTRDSSDVLPEPTFHNGPLWHATAVSTVVNHCEAPADRLERR